MVEKIKAWHKESEVKLDEEGFFLIFIDKEKNKIIVEHHLNVKSNGMIKTGKLNKIIEGENAEEICHTIIREGLLSDLAHASYLGRELQKAEIALKNNMDYVQDEELGGFKNG